MWKAADIRKAIKEGRKPVPGPPGGGSDDIDPIDSPSSAHVRSCNIQFCCLSLALTQLRSRSIYS